MNIENLNKQLEEDAREFKNFKKVVKKSGYSSKKINKYIQKKLGKYDPTIKYIENLKYKGRDIVGIKFTENKFENRYFKIDDVQTLSDKFSKYLHTKGVEGLFMTTMEYGPLTWRSGYLRDIGDDVELYDPDLYYKNHNIKKPKKIKSFYMFVGLGNKKKPQGGNDDPPRYMA